MVRQGIPFGRRALIYGALGLVTGLTFGFGASAETLDTLYEAAKKDGKISVSGAPSPLLRNELVKVFSKRFPGIDVEYQGMAGQALGAKLRAERRAGINSLDVVISGTSTGTAMLKPHGTLGNLESLIVVDEARDPSKWLGGKLDWVDAQKTMLAMTSIMLNPVIVNTDLVKPGELTSDKDLLDPKWKGKIASNNPEAPGATRVYFRNFYDRHGPQFLRDLRKQDLVVTNDLRQLVDWVAKGRYAIGLGYSPSTVNIYLEQGIKTVGVSHFRTWKDEQVVTPGFGALMVMAKPPHPDAAKLFVNWVLTKEGQGVIARGLQYPSRRIDVPADVVPEYLRLTDGLKYSYAYTEEYLNHPNEKAMAKLIKELGFGR